jgi:DNA-binding IscR family transcriptional regulator
MLIHTGFILEDSSHECVARTVIRAIEHPNLSRIAQNAQMEIENMCSFRSLIEQYRNTLARYISLIPINQVLRLGHW